MCQGKPNMAYYLTGLLPLLAHIYEIRMHRDTTSFGDSQIAQQIVVGPFSKSKFGLFPQEQIVHGCWQGNIRH